MADSDDFPKLHSPFVREENAEGDYVVTPEVQEGHEWVFEEAERVIAAEKLHGTNCSVILEEGDVQAVFTRMGPKPCNEVDPFTRTHGFIIDGVQRAVRRGWFNDFDDGQIYGELIGEKVHGNPYDLNGHLFVPFDYLRDHCAYRSYGDHPTDFDSISKWFSDGISSLFYARWHNVTHDVAAEKGFVEGIVFYHPETEQMSKLRRSMFPWHDGESATHD